MFAIFLTYIWMYGELLFFRYFGTCYRWFQEKFGVKKPEVHACGHRNCGGCGHHHEHKCDESDCEEECDHHNCGECDHKEHKPCCGGCGCNHSQATGSKKQL